MKGFARVRFILFQVMMYLGWAVIALSQTGVNERVAPDRILMPIQETQVVTLAGDVHPLARGEFDDGAVNAETPFERMVLVLEPSAAQQAELDSLLQAQHDANSPLYHRWLTPAEYGARFGATAADLARITAWLSDHGFVVEEIAASRRLVVFSGNAGMVADTFHTEIHRYVVKGVEHIGNAQTRRFRRRWLEWLAVWFRSTISGALRRAGRGWSFLPAQRLGRSTQAEARIICFPRIGPQSTT